MAIDLKKLSERGGRFTVSSGQLQRAIVMDIACKLTELGATELAKHLTRLSTDEWQALVACILDAGQEIFRCQPPQTQARLMELRIQKGLSRNALVVKLKAADRSLKITELNLVHIETSGKERLETPAAWRSALCSFFKTDWDSLCEPISNK